MYSLRCWNLPAGFAEQLDNFGLRETPPRPGSRTSRSDTVTACCPARYPSILFRDPSPQSVRLGTPPAGVGDCGDTGAALDYFTTRDVIRPCRLASCHELDLFLYLLFVQPAGYALEVNARAGGASN